MPVLAHNGMFTGLLYYFQENHQLDGRWTKRLFRPEISKAVRLELMMVITLDYTLLFQIRLRYR